MRKAENGYVSSTDGVGGGIVVDNDEKLGPSPVKIANKSYKKTAYID